MTNPTYEYYGMMAEFWDLFRLLRQKAEKLSLDPNVYQQEMHTLSLPRKYQTILVPSSSFQLLLDPSLPPIVMNKFYEHLLPGGVLAMPFMTLWKKDDPLENEFTREANRLEDGATIRRWQYSRFDRETELEHTIDRYEIIRDGKVVASEEHHQSPATRSYTQQQATALYQEAGFKDIQVFHEFTFELVKPEDTVFSVLGFKSS